MTYSEYIQTIADSEPTDWVYDDARGSYLYLPNISIMMQSKRDNQSEKFYEKWVENYCDETAYIHTIELLYNGMRIDDFYTAAVDGYRMLIPYPKTGTLTITHNQYRIGIILNIPNMVNDIYSFDEYLRQGGVTVQ